MQVPLGKRHHDAVFAELLDNDKVEGTDEQTFFLYKRITPDPQFEKKGAVAELHETHPWAGVFQDVGVFFRGFQEQFLHQLHIAVVRDADRDFEAHHFSGVAPVYDILRYEARVGDNYGDIVVCYDCCAAPLDLDHISLYVAHFDTVTDLDGTFEKDDQAADEIAGDVLQSEADPYADRAGQYVQGGQVDTGRLQNDDESNGYD